MSVGFATSKATIDQQCGLLASQILQWADNAINFNAYLVAAPDADLEALGYTPEDVALLKSAGGDMAKLAQVFRGAVEQTPPYDFRTFVARTAGLQV